MKKVSVHFDEVVGPIKRMHAVNNGPVYKFAEDQRITNIDAFREAGIPYARTHDASFYATYGGEHTVDVHAIFPDFDADPEDPASYDFALTDEYMRVMDFAGVKPFYRLGSKIEHWSKKYGTLPPRDFKKWAVICEHIIRHLTEGWADGHRFNIEYWEIWNEPDLDPDDSTHKRCWGGTQKEFFEFYHIAATHLKEKFPHLKIGGPALASHLDWAEDFLVQLKAPLDFFSWHIYAKDPEKVKKKTLKVRELLDQNGFTGTESILNEWNYVEGWRGDIWVQSLRHEKGMRGAAFIGAVMNLCQKLPLDMLMYYDARPCAMNGMFNTDLVCDKLKGYYPFLAFNALYQLGTEVCSADDADCYINAARKGGEGAVMITCFKDEKGIASEKLEVELSKFGSAFEAEIYLLDANHDLELIRKEQFSGEKNTAILEYAAETVYLIKIHAV